MRAIEGKSLKELRAEEKHRLDWLRFRTRDARGWIWGTVALGGLNAFALVMQAAVLAQLLAAILIEGETVASQLPAILFLVAIYLVRGLLTAAAERSGYETAARVKSALRRDVMRKLVDLGPAYTATRPSGELTSVAVEQIEALDGFLAKYLPQKALAVLAPVIILLAVFPLNSTAGLVLLAGGALVPVVMAITGIGAATAARRQARELSRMSGYFLDRLQGLATLRMFGQAQRELELVGAVAERFRGGTMRILRIAFLSSAALELLSTAAIAGLAIYIGTGLAGLHDHGGVQQLTLADGLFLLVLAPEFFLPLRQLSLHYHDRTAALAAAEAILDILKYKTDAEPEGDGETLPATPPSLTVENLRLTYRGGTRTALDGLDLEIAPGECVALMGTSGSGKTSLMRILMGFTPATEGRMRLDGDPVDGATIRRRAAWVGQNTRLFHGSLRDNVAFARPDASDDEVRAAVTAAGLGQVVADLPDGMDSLVGELGHGLSGGEAQRVALARAYLKDARLLLLDEPTASLDQDSEAAILEALAAMRGGRTLLIATHSAAVAAICDRVIHLSAGRVVEAEAGDV